MHRRGALELATRSLLMVTRRFGDPDGFDDLVQAKDTHLQPSTPNAMITIDAKPAPVTIDPTRTALIVVDMQNDFGAEEGMMHRAGIDISGIRSVIEPCARAIAAARAAETGPCT